MQKYGYSTINSETDLQASLKNSDVILDAIFDFLSASNQTPF